MEEDRADSSYRYEFGAFSFSESRLELRRGEELLKLDNKNRQGLMVFLEHPGEVITHEELLERVWGTRHRSLQSVTNLVHGLRQVLGKEAIQTLQGVGYRFTLPVLRRPERPSAPDLQFVAGQTLTDRPLWTFTEPLVGGQHPDVWLLTHAKTGERRVYKFANDARGLSRLRREVTLSRLVHGQRKGGHPGFVRVMEWRFETPPFFLEMPWAGEDLERFTLRGGLESYSRSERLAAFIGLARSIADSHALAVIHKDLKPRNLLVQPQDEGFRLLVGDFGSGALTRPDALSDLGITRLGLTDLGDTSSSAGTPIWRAPELLDGASPTVKADVYSLGVILFQLLTGDVRRPLGQGWAERLDDPLLVEDIAAAVHENPEKRLSSALELAERLERLEERRAERARAEASRLETERLSQALARARARRPWQWAAAAALVVGLGVSLGLALERERARQQAVAASERADTLRELVVDGFFAELDPNKDLELAAGIARLFESSRERLLARTETEPLLRAALHDSLAQIYLLLSRFDLAQRDLEAALALPDDDPERVLQREAGLLSIMAWRGRSERADAIAERLQAAIDQNRTERLDVLNALATYRYATGDALAARPLYARGFSGLTPEQVAADLRHQIALVNWTRASLLQPSDLTMAAAAFAPLGAALDARLITRPVPRVEILIQRADLAAARGELDRARAHLEQALAIARAELPAGHHSVASVAGQLGRLALVMGDYEQAHAMFSERLATDRRMSEPHARARVATTIVLTVSSLATGRLDEAQALLDEVEGPVREKAGSPALETELGALRVLLAVDRGELAEARRRFETLASDLPDDSRRAEALMRRRWAEVRLLEAEGQLDTALALARATLSEYPQFAPGRSLTASELQRWIDRVTETARSAG